MGWVARGAVECGVKRMRRIIFNAVTVLSLVSCGGTVCVMVRSYWIDDEFRRRRGRGRGWSICELFVGNRLIRGGIGLIIKQNAGVQRSWGGVVESGGGS